MALQPNSSMLDEPRSLIARIRSAFGLRAGNRFAPTQVLAESPGVDPLLVPRVPMNSERIDPALMLQFRSMGFTHAQEITEATHPEFYMGWVELCRRAGFAKPLQLIVTDSKEVNAHNVSENEIGMSTGLLKMLSAREALAVLGHELTHARHDANSSSRAWIEMTGAVSGAIVGSQFGKAVQQRVVKQQPGFIMGVVWETWQFFSMAAVGLAGWMTSKQFSVKPSELRADREGAMISGDPDGLISAFEKMSAMGAGQPGWKNFMRYAWSGYPTFEARIAQLRQVKSQIPQGDTPVYRMVELLANTPQITSPAALKPIETLKPEPQVRGVADVERVVFVPEKTQMH